MKHLWLTFFCLSLSTCKNNLDVSTANVEGTWQVAALHAETPDLTPALIADAETEALSTRYFLQSGNRLKMISIYYSEGHTGTWALDPESRSIVLKSVFSEESSMENFRIEQLSRSEMTWHQDLGEVGSLEFTLKRVKE